MAMFYQAAFHPFQSTHPQGVRHAGCAVYHSCRPFQSAHPQGVRHSAYLIGAELWISIHAPARGATTEFAIPSVLPEFQSTHPQGVRRRQIRGYMLTFGFQSTHPQGVRRGRGYGEADGGAISIHAPARGATSRTYSCRMQGTFQSTHPQGVRLTVLTLQAQIPLFQSTHPPGVRLLWNSSR